MTKVGVIGLGKMGMLHLKNSLHIKDVQVEAVADKSKKAQGQAKSLGVKNVYSDYSELISKSKVDTIIISLPNFLHYDCIMQGIENDLNIFIEKPVANTVKECNEIENKIRDNNSKFMIGHCMRFYPVIQRLKEIHTRGDIGRIEALTIESIMNGPFTHGLIPKPVPEWWFDPDKAGGGVLLDIGYHLIDLFRYYAGDAKVLYADLDHKFNLQVEDSAIILLESLETKARGIINVGWYQKNIFPAYNFRCILHGDAGYLNSEDQMPSNMYLHAVKEGARNFFRRITGRQIRYLSYTYFFEAFYRELEHFYDSIKMDTQPQVSLRDGLEAIKIIEYCYDKYGGKRIE